MAQQEKQPSSANASEKLSAGAAAWLKEHLHVIESRILDEAETLARDESRDRIEPADIAAAAMQYAPGARFPVIEENPIRDIITASFSGMTLAAMLMAIMFSIIWALRPEETAWADIVKLLAGAIVGSAGAGRFRRSNR